MPRDETIRIEADSRWDAVDLARRLGAFHTYLVQLGDSRWLVCVQMHDERDDLRRVRAAAEAWAGERHLESTLRVGESEYALRG